MYTRSLTHGGACTSVNAITYCVWYNIPESAELCTPFYLSKSGYDSLKYICTIDFAEFEEPASSFDNLIKAVRAGKAEEVTAELSKCDDPASSFDNLIKAVRAGKAEEVTAELSKCDDPTSLLEQFTRETCMTPLMLAASEGHVRVMELLVKKGAKLDTMSHTDFISDKSVSALMTAARSNQVRAVQTLISLGADVNLQNKNGSSALLLACKCKGINTKIVDELLSNGASCNPTEGSSKSLLQAVIDNDNVYIAKILLKHGATVCSSDLYEACYKRNFTMVEVLLQSYSKDEINNTHHGFLSPLLVASSHGDNDIVELLLCHGADIDAESTDHKYALLLAIKKGHVSTVELLLKKGAKVKNSIVEAVKLISMTPRDIAESSMHMLPESVVLSIVKLLINRGADVDYEDSQNTWIPLLIAISKKSLKVVELLVENGADVNLLAGAESGPLKMAVEYNQIKIARLLLNKGADVNLKNVSDVTPLMVATTPAMARLLVEHGAKLDEVDNRGKSALLHMVDRSRDECFEACDVLLEEGADSSLSDDSGRSPASIIKEKYDILVSYKLYNKGIETDILMAICIITSNY